MAFTNTWDAAFEAAPADNEDINLGANRIRALKLAVRERMQVDHVWEDAQNDGQHNHLTLPPQVSAPTTASPYGFLYAQTVAGHTELLYKNEAGAIAQLTSNGGVNPVFAGNLNVGGSFGVNVDASVGGELFLSTGLTNQFYLLTTAPFLHKTINVDTNCYIQFNMTTRQFAFVVDGVVELLVPP